MMLIFFATATYYAIFEGSVIAVAFQHYTGLSYPLAALIVVVDSVVLIFGSIQNWLDKLNGVLLPFYLLGIIADDIDFGIGLSDDVKKSADTVTDLLLKSINCSQKGVYQ